MVTPAGFEPTLSTWEADLLNLLEDEAIAAPIFSAFLIRLD